MVRYSPWKPLFRHINMTKDIVIQLNNATFEYPGNDPLFSDVKLTIFKGDVAAIVGINGAGKSTLLKVLSGELELSAGSVETHCKPYYVPQVDLSVHDEGKLVYEYIEKYYDNWWELPNETERLFGLTIDTNAPITTLSGGELIKLNLAIAIQHKPDLLILDEPTNHLDIKSISNLIEFINDTSKNKYTYILVSHDTFFLDQVVTRVFELNNQTLTTYTGNYSFYKEQKELHEAGVRRQNAVAMSKLLNAEEQAQKQMEKAEQRAAKTKKDIHEGKERDKMLIGKKQDSGSTTSKALKKTFERIQTEAEDALEESKLEEQRKLAFMNIKNTNNKGIKVLYTLDKASLYIKERLAVEDISFQLMSNDRVVIAGSNGSGKSSFIKALINATYPNKYAYADYRLEGTLTKAQNLKMVYIDQNYSLIDPNKNLIDNLMNYNPEYTMDKAKEQLGKFQFKEKNELNKLGVHLSGGEMVRLIMAMITAFPIDLIILDEPTNNLDVATVETLVKALNNFRGSIIVISHNVDFLSSINITSSYIINNKKFKLLPVDPANKEKYYNTLVNSI